MVGGSHLVRHRLWTLWLLLHQMQYSAPMFPDLQASKLPCRLASLQVVPATANKGCTWTSQISFTASRGGARRAGTHRYVLASRSIVRLAAALSRVKSTRVYSALRVGSWSPGQSQRQYCERPPRELPAARCRTTRA